MNSQSLKEEGNRDEKVFRQNFTDSLLSCFIIMARRGSPNCSKVLKEYYSAYKKITQITNEGKICVIFFLNHGIE
jgi:hypothetical protein